MINDPDEFCPICDTEPANPTWHFNGSDFCSAEHMRRAMTDAGVPAWFVTYGLGQYRGGAYSVVEAATEAEARQVINRRRGASWAFLYPIEDLERHIDAGWLEHGEVPL